MQCYNHVDTGAVAQCSDCAKGLCKECIDRFHNYVDEPFCSTCFEKEINGAISILKKNRRSLCISIIWTLIFLGLGIASAIANMDKSTADIIANACGFFAIGGAPTLFKLNSSSSTVVIYESLMYKIGKWIMYIIISSFLAPFVFIYAIYKFFQNKKELAHFQSVLNAFQANEI